MTSFRRIEANRCNRIALGLYRFVATFGCADVLRSSMLAERTQIYIARSMTQTETLNRRTALDTGAGDDAKGNGTREVVFRRRLYGLPKSYPTRGISVADRKARSAPLSNNAKRFMPALQPCRRLWARQDIATAGPLRPNKIDGPISQRSELPAHRRATKELAEIGRSNSFRRVYGFHNKKPRDVVPGFCSGSKGS